VKAVMNPSLLIRLDARLRETRLLEVLTHRAIVLTPSSPKKFLLRSRWTILPLVSNYRISLMPMAKLLPKFIWLNLKWPLKQFWLT
jgi:hypothetical protein